MTPQQAADNLKTPALLTLRQNFRQAGHDLRFVGGCVRDGLLGLTPHDVDLHTDATPLEQVKIYRQHGVHHIPTGVDHGTITVVLEGATHEITSLRLDVATDGRRATVAHTRDWLADLDRRDFTFNSMSLGFDGDMLDPHGGASDLHNGIVRFVGDAQLRVQEDALRILRWFRFRARFGMDMESDAHHACTRSRGLLRHISRQRIWSELQLLLTGPNALEIVSDLHTTGVAESCGLPAVNWFPAHRDRTYPQEVFARTNHAVTRLWSFHHHQTMRLLESFKCSNDDKELCNMLDCWVVRNTHTPSMLLAMDMLTREQALQVAAVKLWEPLEMAMLEVWQPPKFPVKGADLIAEGHQPGPSFSVVLSELKFLWANTNFTLSKRELLDRIEPCWLT
jgi:poly(A) polymerase